MSPESWSEMRKTVIDSISNNNRMLSKLDGQMKVEFEKLTSQITNFKHDIFIIFQGDPKEKDSIGIIGRVKNLEDDKEKKDKREVRNQYIIAGIIVTVLGQLVFNFLTK